eukprot:6198489-Pleurochrysis_carterae.AAC.1
MQEIEDAMCGMGEERHDSYATDIESNGTNLQAHTLGDENQDEADIFQQQLVECFERSKWSSEWDHIGRGIVMWTPCTAPCALRDSDAAERQYRLNSAKDFGADSTPETDVEVMQARTTTRRLQWIRAPLHVYACVCACVWRVHLRGRVCAPAWAYSRPCAIWPACKRACVRACVHACASAFVPVRFLRFCTCT